MSVPAAGDCFHCGEPVPPGTCHSVVVDGAPREMCCAGCAAVAGAISEHGLTGYYHNRSELPRRDLAASCAAADLAVYDTDEVQRPFVRQCPGGIRQAVLLVEGIACGGCVWLIERRLASLEGVKSAAVNLAARRVQVEWDEKRVRLSVILAALSQLGYRTQGFDPVKSASAARRERRALLWRLFVAGLAMMQVMMYAFPVYLSDGDMTPDVMGLMRWAGLTLTIPVMLWSAAPFFATAWRELRVRRVGMDTPVALGIAIAFTASAWATLSGRGEVYFDSIAMFVFLLLGARYLELMARAKAGESQQRLVQHTPAVAERLMAGADTAATERVAAAQLVPGDLVRVAPGGIIPTDGVVTDGEGAVDESILTGEARPVAKRAGDTVLGGSVNLQNPLTARVTRVGPETVLAGIVRLMDRAQAEKPHIAQLADRVAQWFVMALIAVALATAGVWWWIDPARALWVMVAVLVVSCPCALSLATPAALTAATDALHRCGILVTRGHALETLARATHVVFDKTGTLTRGRLSVIGVIPLGAHDRETCLALARALELGSEHPIARALGFAAAGNGAPKATGFRNYTGRGIEARIAGRSVRIGSPAFVSELAQRPPPSELIYVPDEVMVVALGDESGYLALLTFGDALRAGARALVRELQARGKVVCVLSGDRGATVADIARALEIGVARGDAAPADKLAFVRDLQAHGAVVAMVGDGVNDAPVLAQAQVSIAMGGGTDLAHASADMVLLSENLGRLLPAFDVAHGAIRIIRQNLAWAVAYNVVAIPLAAAGWITPLAAGIGMALSSLAVVANALRIKAPDQGAARRMPARGDTTRAPVIS